MKKSGPHLTKLIKLEYLKLENRRVLLIQILVSAWPEKSNAVAEPDVPRVAVAARRRRETPPPPLRQVDPDAKVGPENLGARGETEIRGPLVQIPK